MTELDLDEPTLERVPLALEQRVTLGAGSGAPDELDDRIALGRPACVALDLATVDEAARVFLQGRTTSSFWLVGLTCSFLAVNDEPIDRAWMEVLLRTESPADASDPTAWSMEPLALTTTRQVSKTVKLDASLKLTSEVIPIEIGPGVSSETRTEGEVTIPYVEAHREGTSRPAWIFTRTPMTEVRGVHRLRAVVELPAGAIGQAEVRAGATLRLKRFGLIPYKAALADIPDQQLIQLGG